MRVFFLFLFSSFFLACGSNKNERLFQAYYVPFEVQLTQSADVRYPELDTAYQAYQAEDYATVERITSGFIDEYYPIPQVMFAQTIAFLELGRNEEAIANFQTLSMHPVFGSQAKWYLGLVHLRVGDRASAIPIFEELSASFLPEREPASAILQELQAGR